VKQSSSLSLNQVQPVEVEGLEDEYSAPKLSLSTSSKRGFVLTLIQQAAALCSNVLGL
jgi:hypothetical protein